MRDTQRAAWAMPAALAASLLAVPAPAWAAGYYLQEQSARATGRAYSGEAADEGPDSLWWNPAAIAGIGHSELDSTLSGILVWSKATDAGSTIARFGRASGVGGESATSGVVESGLLPTGAAALRLDDQWALGLALTSPFSTTTQYDTASWTRYAALTSRLRTVDIQPSVAWRPTRWLALGIGPNLEYVTESLSAALPNLSALQPDGIESLHGTGWNAGYNAGLQLHLLDERLVLGAAYRSAIHHTFAGSLDVSGLTGYLAGQNFFSDNARFNFTTPWAATFAVRVRATRRLTLDLQIVRTGWGVFDNVTITEPVRAVTQEGYHDTTSEAIGLDYTLTQRWMVRAGVQYDPTPTPAATRDPRVPDADRLLFAVGTSVRASDALTVDASAMLIDFGASHITRDASAYSGTVLSTPIEILGEVHATAVVLALGTRLQF